MNIMTFIFKYSSIATVPHNHDTSILFPPRVLTSSYTTPRKNSDCFSVEKPMNKPQLNGSKHILQDAILMKNIAKGDEKSCQLVMETHLTRVYRVAYRILKQSGEAEDVTQEAFIKLWQSAPKWKPQAKIMTWLYRVTYNAALDRLRKRPLRTEVNIEDYQNYISAPANSEHSIEKLEIAAEAQKLHQAITQLPKRQKIVIMLWYFEKLKIKDISHTMQISLRATESLLKRARSRLKSFLQQQKAF